MNDAETCSFLEFIDKIDPSIKFFHESPRVSEIEHDDHNSFLQNLWFFELGKNIKVIFVLYHVDFQFAMSS